MLNTLTFVNETVNQTRTSSGFTPGELAMLLDIFNGTALTSGAIDRDSLLLQVGDSFDLYPDLYEGKWGVNQADMLVKLNTLSDWQAACLQLWAVDFWTSGICELPDAVNRYVLGKITISTRLAEALTALQRAADLQEKSKSAFKSKVIAEARAETEKALTIITDLLG